MWTIKAPNFEVDISSQYKRKITRTNGIYYAMIHNSTYSIVLRNNTSTRCDATVSIDGRSVGTFRVDSSASTTIKRPVDQNNHFVFLSEKSELAKKSGVVASPQNGVITVFFHSEKEAVVYAPCRHSYTNSYDSDEYEIVTNSYSTKSTNSFAMGMGNNRRLESDMEAGVTALGNATSQSFRQVQQISNYDETKSQTIKITLVAETTQPPQVQRSPIPPSGFPMIPKGIISGQWIVDDGGEYEEVRSY